MANLEESPVIEQEADVSFVFGGGRAVQRFFRSILVIACDRGELGEQQVRETTVCEHEVVKITRLQVAGAGFEVSGNEKENFVGEVEEGHRDRIRGRFVFCEGRRSVGMTIIIMKVKVEKSG